MKRPSPEPTPQPSGKTRTWWHPLLANLLRWPLGEHYRVEEEVNVGRKPLQIDVLLLPPDQLNLVVIAPRLTEPYRQELRTCGATAEQEEAGIWRLRGGALLHAMWLLETEVLAGRE